MRERRDSSPLADVAIRTGRKTAVTGAALRADARAALQSVQTASGSDSSARGRYSISRFVEISCHEIGCLNGLCFMVENRVATVLLRAVGRLSGVSRTPFGRIRAACGRIADTPQAPSVRSWPARGPSLLLSLPSSTHGRSGSGDPLGLNSSVTIRWTTFLEETRPVPRLPHRPSAGRTPSRSQLLQAGAIGYDRSTERDAFARRSPIAKLQRPAHDRFGTFSAGSIVFVLISAAARRRSRGRVA